jgi:hypothetical protein
MSDTFEIDPDFVAPRPKKQPRKAASQPVQAPITPSVAAANGGVVGFYTQNKMLIIIAVAIVIVLLICLAYWYFAKSKEPIHPVKPKQPPDNVVQTDLNQVMTKSQPTPPPDQPKPVEPDRSPEEPSESLSNNDSRPITHEGLVMNADDAEIDKYMNPGEPSFEQVEPKTPKTNSKNIVNTPVQSTDDDRSVLLDDLADLE